MTTGAVVVIANAGGTELELLTRIVDAMGLRAIPVEADGTADVAAKIADAISDAGASGILLDLGTESTSILAGLRGHPLASVAEARALVLADGPAGGRLAWQAGADELLIRPFHVDELRNALRAALERPEEARGAARTEGLASLAAEV